MSNARNTILADLFLRGLPYLLIALMLFFLGIVTGVIAAEQLSANQTHEMLTYIHDFISHIDSIQPDNGEFARTAIAKGLISIVAVYILGLTVIGMPITLLIVFARGVILGFAIDFLIHSLSSGGFLLALVSVAPHNLLYVPALIIGVASSLRFGMLLLKRNFDTRIPVIPNFFKYSAIMLGVLAITVVGGIVESHVSPAFTKMAAEALQNSILPLTGN